MVTNKMFAAIAILAGVGGAFFSWKFFPYLTQSARASAVIPPPPAVTIEFEERLTNATKSGTPIGSYRTEVHRGDGAFAEINRYQSILTNVHAYTRSDISLPNGTMIQVIPEVNAFSAMKLPRRDAMLSSQRLNPATDCSTRADKSIAGQVVGEDTILGIRTVRFENENPSAKMASWRAPSLGCVELRRLAQFKNRSGAITDTSDLQAISVTTSAAASAFVVPAGLELVSMWDLTRKLSVKLTGSEPPEKDYKNFKQAHELFPRFKFDPRASE